MITPDYPRYCNDCPELEFVIELMVGAIESGGPEDFYRCKKRHNLYYYYENRRYVHCPDKPKPDTW